MAGILPDDLIFVILLRLPVNSLLRFRCVSKKWRDIIGSSGFVKSHLCQSTIATPMINIVLENTGHACSYVKLAKLCHDSAGIVVEKYKYTFPEVSLPFGPARILGSCNGLLCIYDDNRRVILLNPSTRKCCKFTDIKEDHYAFVFTRWFWGFGYDGENDDYKVVAMSMSSLLNNKLTPTLAWIYSLKFGAWRRIDNLPNYRFGPPKHGVYLGNAIHWLAYDQSSRFVSAFDLGTEEFRLVMLPEHQIYDSLSPNLEVVDGCLCLCRYSFENSFVLDMWIMRDYGAEESWTRLIKIDGGPGLFVLTMNPLAFSEDGKLLLVHVKKCDDMDEGLVWYNLETRSFKRDIDNLPPNLGHVPYVHIPSLVNPNQYSCLRN